MNVPPDSALVEELVLGDLARLPVTVRDEHQLDRPVLGAMKLVEQEEVAARQVLLHRDMDPGCP